MLNVQYIRRLPNGRVLTVKGLQWWSYRRGPEPTLMGMTTEAAMELLDDMERDGVVSDVAMKTDYSMMDR